MSTHIQNAFNELKELITQKTPVEQLAASYVHNYADISYELSKMTDKVFQEGNSQVKMTCILLAYQLLKQSNGGNNAQHFQRGFAQRLKFFLQEIARLEVSQTAQSCIFKIIDSLEQMNILSSIYFGKLKDIATKIVGNMGSIYQSNKNIDQIAQPIIKKYNKTQMLKFDDVLSQNEFKKIYNIFHKFTLLQQKQINQLNRSNNLGANPSNYESDQQNVNEIQQQGRSRQYDLEQIIKQCHSSIAQIRRSMNKQIQIYKLNTNEQQAWQN